MRFQHLKRLAIFAPIFFIGTLELSRLAMGSVEGSGRSHLLVAGLILFGAVLFYGALLTLIEQRQRRLEARNQELSALRGANLAISSELSLDVVLQTIVDQACNLLATRYGALAVYEENGKIRSFLTAGIDETKRRAIGSLPTGKGLLAVGLREGQCLRTADLTQDVRSHGFPENHPPMHSLLAVPVICRSPFRGNLYLSEKLDQGKFSEADEQTLGRFASQAAIAIDNAHLHSQVASLAIMEERLRLAHEMHDGQAQMLAYVNTKAQAVEEFLRAGKTDKAKENLSALASAAREVYADVREGILGLRTLIGADGGLEEALRHHVTQWEDQNGIQAELVIDELPPLGVDVELQLLRILQEALANVRKHSKAEVVRIELNQRQKAVTIVVQDSGVGFDAQDFDRDRRPRFGLSTMRERAETIGAALQIKSQPGSGTRVELIYPLPREHAS